MYLGEITRNILTALIDAAPKSLLFSGKATPSLNTMWGLDTSVMSDVEEAWEGTETGGSTKSHEPLAFASFDPEQLAPEVKLRLERVRKVVAEKLGYADGSVSLKDAAVCDPSTPRSRYPDSNRCRRSYDGPLRWSLGVRLC